MDTDSTYYIGSGATILAVGSNGMIENPTKMDQTVLCTSETGGDRPGNNNIILSICPNKKYSYVLYTSPKLTAGTTYSMYSGGSVSGNKLSFLLYMFFLHMSFRQHLSQYGLVLAVQTARP
ncbi:hypothetical protein [uncultured Eubacterium sp.]|uniref:hypothetical protein n=1 Tax=uncultured Eubacterium sp. TaxID=165185 RepID=UPI0026710EB2|nr:hypothetical protein [uncultured Eubacterium sp.]